MAHTPEILVIIIYFLWMDMRHFSFALRHTFTYVMIFFSHNPLHFSEKCLLKMFCISCKTSHIIWYMYLVHRERYGSLGSRIDNHHHY